MPMPLSLKKAIQSNQDSRYARRTVVLRDLPGDNLSQVMIVNGASQIRVSGTSMDYLTPSTLVVVPNQELALYS